MSHIFFNEKLLFAILLCGAGGAFQYAGLFSPTQLNVLCLFLFAFGVKRYLRTGFDAPDYLLAGFVAYFFLVCMGRSESPYAIFAYIYYFICAFFSAKFGQYLAAIVIKGSMEKFFNFSNTFFACQIPILLIQNLFGDTIGANAATAIDAVDMNSGTLYLQMDSTLATLAIAFLILLSSDSFAKYFKINYWFVAAAVVFLTNSTASQGVFMVVTLVIFNRRLFSKLGNNSRLLQLIFIVVAALILGIIFYDYFGSHYSRALDDIEFGFFRKEDGGAAHRLAPLGDLYVYGIDYFGRGLLTYYNPLSKEWLFDSGFSLYYSIYYDLGFFGVLFTLLYYFSQILKIRRDIYSFLQIALLFLSFSFFNFSFSDLIFGFLMSFSVNIIDYSNKVELYV